MASFRVGHPGTSSRADCLCGEGGALALQSLLKARPCLPRSEELARGATHRPARPARAPLPPPAQCGPVCQRIPGLQGGCHGERPASPGGFSLPLPGSSRLHLSLRPEEGRSPHPTPGFCRGGGSETRGPLSPSQAGGPNPGSGDWGLVSPLSPRSSGSGFEQGCCALQCPERGVPGSVCRPTAPSVSSGPRTEGRGEGNRYFSLHSQVHQRTEKPRWVP